MPLLAPCRATLFLGHVPAVLAADGGRWRICGLRRLGFACGIALLNRLREESAIVGGEAAPGGQLELPTVHGAGEDAVFDMTKAREIGLHVRAAALHTVAVHLPELLLRRALGVVAFGVLQ